MRVTVVGIGGLGHLAIPLAAAMGAVVTAVSGSPSKEAEAKSLGATNFVLSKDAEAHYGTQEVVLNCASGGKGFDEMVKMCMALLEPDGSFCLVGLPVADIKIPVLDLVFNQKKVLGSIVGGRRDMNELLQFCVDKGKSPLAHKTEVPLASVKLLQLCDLGGMKIQG
eukprot:gene4158-14257_t